MIRCKCLKLTDMDEAVYFRLRASASEARRERADRCRQREDGVRLLAAEALLRHTLLECFGRPDILIRLGPEGKPVLADRPDFCFNLSHSGQWVVLAWDSKPVGVDVEQIAAKPTLRMIAHRHFDVLERQYLLSAPDEQEALRRFFRLWTAKESYLKYLGVGLTRPLSSFCVLEEIPGVFFHHTVLDGAMLCICGEVQCVELEYVDLETVIKNVQTN